MKIIGSRIESNCVEIWAVKRDFLITICYQQYINNVMACFPLWHLISEQTEHHQTIRLCAHIFKKYLFQIFYKGVSPGKWLGILSPGSPHFLLQSQVCEKRGYQHIFVAGFSKLFATTWAEIAEMKKFCITQSCTKLFSVLLWWRSLQRSLSQLRDICLQCQNLKNMNALGIGAMWVSQGL